MSFTLNQQVIADSGGRIKYKYINPKGNRHYHVGVWLEGTLIELSTVEYVEYKLHPTFKNPVRSSSNKENKFSITFWTWGMFQITANIHKLDGATETINYYLSYSLPADDGMNYIDVSTTK